MDTEAVLRRQRAAQRAFHRMLDGASPGARFVERDDGIGYLVTPARPERSLVNAVVYEDGSALRAALPELRAVYEAAGVDAWTVWVHIDDEDAAHACAEAGHVLDARPAVMWASLDEMELDDVASDRALDLDQQPPWPVLGAINDAAYGLPDNHFAAILADVDESLGSAVVARVDGTPAACAATSVAEGNAGMYMVATRPEHRGRGLATGCMRHLLREAREAGATTTTLEATIMGAPVYACMGYETVGHLEMWERRRT
jgi:ribosomal protein S18 acetylase RimI-like enzyme